MVLHKTHVIDLNSWYSIGTPESYPDERAECCPCAGFLKYVYFPQSVHVMCKMLRVTYQTPHLTCHVSGVMCYIFFFFAFTKQFREGFNNKKEQACCAVRRLQAQTLPEEAPPISKFTPSVKLP